MYFAKGVRLRTQKSGKTWALALLLWPVLEVLLWLLLPLLVIALIWIAMPWKRLLAGLLACCFCSTVGCTSLLPTRWDCRPSPTLMMDEDSPSLTSWSSRITGVEAQINCNF